MRVGDNVRVRGANKVGKVRRIKDKNVEVEWIFEKIMSSGSFKHIVEYEIDDLEGV
ncbi:hypothetical protein FHS16_005520 [Paenibacillus endophyticus]|uniref:Uncharacterized protein n=1 Tax=Paenibacillus endophyticus TaxID=1294268 RepID=A0A7W5GDT1_9BACL|nr:hypothetical protein [Paenibacillus endophyticus]MBB3155412.1 hypothetical protein [Paenibacillus endophyticus]